MMNKDRAVLFDLDGTLWDSSRQITDAWNTVLEKQNRMGHSHEFYTSLLGKPMDEIAMAIYPDCSEAEALALMDEVMEYENEYLRKNEAALYLDLEDTLRKLKDNYFLGIVSNCQSGYIEAFLQAHHLADYFDDKECFGNTGCYKDENIRRMISRNKIQKALYVGDIEADMNSSHKAGIPFILAEYGFGQADSKYRISSLKELPDKAHTVFETEF